MVLWYVRTLITYQYFHILLYHVSWLLVTLNCKPKCPSISHGINSFVNALKFCVIDLSIFPIYLVDECMI